MNELTVRARGRRYTVRAMTDDDGAAMLASFDRLSPASLRFRFFSPVPRLTPGIAADLTRIDDARIVLLAVDEAGDVAAEARAVRHRDDPATADVAVTVDEAHQRRGLGSKLLRVLGTEARRAGIDRLVGHVLLDNAAGQALLVAARAACWIDEPGVMGFEIPLGRRAVSPEIAARRTLGLAS
jgi:GNAT superfamily N-acetyltransferase